MCHIFQQFTSNLSVLSETQHPWFYLSRSFSSLESPQLVPAAKKENKDEGTMLLCMRDLAVPYQTQTQFIIFQTLFHTNNFAVSLMHLSVYLFPSTICLSCSLARHMFTANTPPRWQMSSRANFIGINKKARARWKAMERANVIWGEERVFGGRITITTASAKKRFLFCLSH